MKDGTYRTSALQGRRYAYGDDVAFEIRSNWKNGYQVGMVEGTWMKIHPTHKSFTQESISNAVVECANETGAPFVGVWTDKSGIIHIDPSKYIYHKINAMQYAKENKQLCVWSWSDMSEVEVEY